MKKLIITSCLILLCMGIMAQERSEVALGVNLTGNITAYTHETNGASTEQFKPNVGYGAGLFVAIPVADRFNIQAEVQYDALRATLNPTPRNIPFRSDRAYSKREYITVPVMLQYEFGKRHKFFVNFGPALKFNLSSLYRLEYDDQYFSEFTDPAHLIPAHTETTNNRDDEHRIVVALVAGIGMKIPMAKKVDFIWEARISGDISRVRNPNIIYLNGTQAINLALRVGVAYKF